MHVQQVEISGYRSLRHIRFDLDQINIVVGENGTGKSNLYRMLYLLHAAASGRFANELAEEGGLPSALWAGPRSHLEAGHLCIRVKFDELEFELMCGRIPTKPPSQILAEPPQYFSNDPDIKREQLKLYYMGKANTLVDRKGGMLSARNMDGRVVEFPLALRGSESLLSGLREPQRFPELNTLREEFLNWRFYHQFRVDQSSPLRHPQVGVFTPALAHDGKDLAAALASIFDIGSRARLDELIGDAFPGAQLDIQKTEDGVFSFSLLIPELFRPFQAYELSDGTLHYLCLLAALLSPRPPGFMVLNEPETSLHPDLYSPLARLIVEAAKHTQFFITTHSKEFAAQLSRQSKVKVTELEKIDGETRIAGVPRI